MADNNSAFQPKCPSCGGPMEFSPRDQKLKCVYCGTTKELDLTTQNPKENDFEEWSKKTAEDLSNVGTEMREVKCAQCGATVTLEGESSGKCPFCGTPLVVDQAEVKRVWQPEYIVPFKIAKAECNDIFGKWINGKFFCPSKFKNGSVVADSFKGVFLPFWTYDAKAVTTYTGEKGRTEKRKDKDGKEESYTEWRPVSGFLGILLLSLSSISAWSQTISKRFAWRGSVGKITQVEVVLEQRTDGLTAGTVSYLNASDKTPRLLIGELSNGYICLIEYQNDGTQKGSWILRTKDGIATGDWSNRAATVEKKVSLSKPISIPTSFTSLLIPETPDSIGRRYSFTIPPSRKGDDSFGGSFTFRGAGKNKIAFSCSVYLGNVAEGKSAKGRPITLNGNKFRYVYSNEKDEFGCRYTFKGEFFKRFLYTHDVVNNEYCFGHGVSFAGVYIKTVK